MKILSSLDYLKQDLPRLGDKVAAEAAVHVWSARPAMSEVGPWRTLGDWKYFGRCWKKGHNQL
jgi:hypothetical protein